MYQRDFDAEQHETHLHRQESRRWEATLQAGGDDDWTPDEIAANPLPPLSEGSFENSAAAIQDKHKFFTVLTAVFEESKVEQIKENLEMEDNKTPIPQNVIDALAAVRETGAINMFDRRGVIEIVLELDEDGELWGDAYDWLNDNKSLYMDALNAMGAQVKD